jgi:hypothetical protein
MLDMVATSKSLASRQVSVQVLIINDNSTFEYCYLILKKKNYNEILRKDT